MKKIYILSIVLFSMMTNAFSQSEQYLGEIRLMSFNYAPKGWMKCEGQLLPINQNQALFAIIGTMYGGNGTTNFALPDLRGRVLVGAGNSMTVGEKAGSESVTITPSNIPAHSHFEPVKYSTSTATQSTPTTTATFSAPVMIVNNAPKTALAYSNQAPTVVLAGATPTSTDGGVQSPQPITNAQPYLGLMYVIAVQGIFPSQN
jgi:microcystin-dependent protein